MTPQEAIDYFKMRLSDTVRYANGKQTRQREAFEIAIEALEKQIPERVSFTSMNYGTVTCSNCHKPIRLYDYSITEEWVKDNKYCRHCGQKLREGE